MTKNSNNLLQDMAIIVLSIVIAVVLAKTGALADILTSSKESGRLGSFIAGIFFTSIFTVAPAAVTLGALAQADSIAQTALFGAFGAVLGDLIIFRFVRDRFSVHLMELLRERGGGRRTVTLFRLKSFRWLTFLAGGLIVASPLPDELGISLLGFSKLKTSLFIPLSFVFNFAGIFLIGIAARSF